MAYATEADLNFDDAELTALTESKSAVGVKVASVINLALEQGARKIRDRLQGKYVLPSSAPYPQSLVDLNAELSRYLLFRHRPNRVPPQTVIDDYKQALKDLDAYAEGRMVLEGVARVEAATNPAPSGGAVDPELERKFGRRKDRLG